jgi:dienelactone hydrolase
MKAAEYSNLHPTMWNYLRTLLNNAMLFRKSWAILIAIFIATFSLVAQNSRDTTFPYNHLPETFPGTKSLSPSSDRSQKMLDGAHLLIEEEIERSISGRTKFWSRDFSSEKAYQLSVEPNRNRFMKYIGMEDKMAPVKNYNIGFPDKIPAVFMEKIAVDNNSELVAETSSYFVYQVRWPVLNRVNGEGLLLKPKNKIIANVIAVPDADQTPEQLAGLAKGVPLASQFARHLAENGYQVIVPLLISREYIFPGKHEQQTYREWIYRQAYHMGRHVIGFEVEKIMAAVDWFKKSDSLIKIGVAGYGEGGLLAFYSAAVDKRIDAVLISGYFNNRQKVWDEPIYRNVWGLLTEFGDAEIASMIAPRPMLIEYSSQPNINDIIPASQNADSSVEGFHYDGYKGKIQTPLFKDVQTEYLRISSLVKNNFQQRELIAGENNKAVEFGSEKALKKFVALLGQNSLVINNKEFVTDKRIHFDPGQRQLRQVKELEDHVQWLMRVSDQVRNEKFLYKIMAEFGERNWSGKSYHPYFSPDRFISQSKEYRKYFQEEVMGKLDEKFLPPDAHTSKIYDRERWTGYEVVIDVYKNLFTSGILLIPKDIKAGEKRPVVVCQHGRNDIPKRLVEGNANYYSDVAAKLADQGFIVYVPQNPYRGEDRYRWLSRKANSVKCTLFSFIIAQHDQTVRWLGSLPFADSKRIAFYGLSYGGETAMRVPPVVEGYCLSICTGDFGDWTRKVVDTYNPRSFMGTIEWEMPYFNSGNTFSHAEMAYLIFPRPFMVERGHHDMVEPDEWVAYEYAKVKYLYDQFNMEDKTEIEFFNGGHSMKLDGTIKFLHKHLNWP